MLNNNKNVKKVDITQYEPNEFGMGALFADLHGDTVKYLKKQKYVPNLDTERRSMDM